MSDDRPDIASWLLRSAKITQFLLAADHKDNKGREKFFRDFGFNADNPEILARALIQQPRAAHTFKRQIVQMTSVRLAYDGVMETPDGRGAHVRTIWNFDEPSCAKFITVKPLKRMT